MHWQFGQEALGFILMTDDLIMRGESGFEQTIDEEFRQGVGDADAQPDADCAGAVLQGAAEFAAQRKYFVGVIEHRASGFGHHEIAAFLAEELRADRRLQNRDLAADRRLRQSELFARAGDAALPGDVPEVEQMLIVETFHGSIAFIDVTNLYILIFNLNPLRHL